MTIFFSLNPSQFFEQILFPPANQPDTKVCMHAYLFPFPISHPINNSTEYESAISEWFTTVFLLTSYHKVILYSFSGFSTHSHTHTRSDKHVRCSVYRGFWSVFMLIGVVSVVLGGFFIICAAPFASHNLYKAGGVLFLTSGQTFRTITPVFFYI